MPSLNVRLHERGKWIEVDDPGAQVEALLCDGMCVLIAYASGKLTASETKEALGLDATGMRSLVEIFVQCEQRGVEYSNAVYEAWTLPQKLKDGAP